MEKDWQLVYSSAHEHKVEMVRAVLQDQQIPCVVINKKDSAYLFGELELYVNSDMVLEAKQIINKESL